MKQTYRVQLINNEFIDVQAESPKDAAEQVVVCVEPVIAYSN